MSSDPSPPNARLNGRDHRQTETMAAGRALVNAVRHDIAAIWARLDRAARPEHQDTTEAHKRGFNVPWRLAKGIAALTVIAALLFCGTMLWVLRDLPHDGVPLGRERAILLEATDGKPLGRVGPLKVSASARNDFPKPVVGAVLSIEDRRFYKHWGVDVSGIARAAYRNYRSGAAVEGGSTITQQLVKLRLVGRERSLSRKLREAFAALWLETRLSKDEILTRYLNSVYMGAGAQGVPAAAELYFSKRPQDLTLPEAAMLAGIIKAPSRFNPLQNLAGAQARAAVVIRAMVENGQIDKSTGDAAIAHPALLNTSAIASDDGTWFSDWVAGEAQDVTGGLAGTVRVRTTLVPRMQTAAENAIAEGLNNSASQNVSQAALVAMRPDGAVLAMVGGRHYKQSQFNRAVQARRQPGSAFKLFVYMAAVRSGLDPDDTIDASPINIAGWEPENYGGGSYDTVTLADAFAHSINTAAVRLANEVGIDKVISAARDLGIEGPLPAVPSLALGSADVTLINLTAAYAGVLAGRAPVRPFGVASFAAEEKPRLVSIGAPANAQKPLGDVQDKLIELLRLPVERGTARAAAIDGFAAGKTGTTQDHRDAWFVGFTEKLVVGVWVGNDDRSPMEGVTGGSVPAAIWKSFVEKSGEPTAPEPAIGELPAAGTSPVLAESENVSCDLRACSSKYQSFDAADCTYQPYGGAARQRCEEGTRNPSTAETKNGCNLTACAAAYSSFRVADCSYQPLEGGPRRLCPKRDAGKRADDPNLGYPPQDNGKAKDPDYRSDGNFRRLVKSYLRP